jgi:hypothetical protein
MGSLAPLLTTIDSPSPIAIDTLSSTVINFYPRSTGSALATTRGFSLTIGTLNFHVDDAGMSRLLPAVEPLPSTPRLHRSLSPNECLRTTPCQHHRRHLLALAECQNRRLASSDRTSFKINHHPQPSHTESTTTPNTSWEAGTSPHKRSSDAETHAVALPQST